MYRILLVASIWIPWAFTAKADDNARLNQVLTESTDKLGYATVLRLKNFKLVEATRKEWFYLDKQRPKLYLFDSYESLLQTLADPSASSDGEISHPLKLDQNLMDLLKCLANQYEQTKGLLHLDIHGFVSGLKAVLMNQIQSARLKADRLINKIIAGEFISAGVSPDFASKCSYDSCERSVTINRRSTVTLYIWQTTLGRLGHVAMRTYFGGEDGEGEYMSYYPPHSFVESLSDDSQEGRPTKVYHLTFFNEVAIEKVNLLFQQFKQEPHHKWEMFNLNLHSHFSGSVSDLNFNCASLIFYLLKSGMEGPNSEIFERANADIHFITPNNFIHICDQIQEEQMNYLRILVSKGYRSWILFHFGGKNLTNEPSEPSIGSLFQKPTILPVAVLTSVLAFLCSNHDKKLVLESEE